MPLLIACRSGVGRHDSSRALSGPRSTGVDRQYAALAVLLGLNGLRVSEARATDIGFDRGQRTRQILGKDNKPAGIPLVPRTGRTIDLAVGERLTGRADAEFARAAVSISRPRVAVVGRPWRVATIRFGRRRARRVLER